MTNSEIKKDELKPCPFCGYSKPSIIIDEYAPIPYLGYKGGIAENVTCPQCLAHVDRKIWNTRTPEPTKAENGLAFNNTMVFHSLVSTFKNDKSKMKDWDSFDFQMLTDWFCMNFKTPSITKEQLLAILPEKKIIPDYLNMNSNDFKSLNGFNEAIDQMKQRIEELWK